MRLVIAILCLVGMADVAQAQGSMSRRVEALQQVPVPPEIPPGVDEIMPLAPGQQAQFGGMLLGTDTAIRWTNALRWWPEAFRLRVSEFGDVVEALEENHQRRYTLAEESYRREINGLREDVRAKTMELAEAAERSWYESPMFGFAMGVLVSGIVGGLIVGLVAAL